MTDHQYNTLWADALVATGPEAFASAWALSSMWEDPEGAEVPQERVQRLQEIYTAAHMPIKDIRAATGLSQAGFAVRFCIPKRTIENWESRHNCPDYLRLLLIQAVGLPTGR